MLAILTYHRCAAPAPGSPKANLCVAPTDFLWQLQWLHDHNIAIVSLDAARAALLGEKPLQRPAVAITFDDGYADNYETALPILKQFSATAAFFPIANWIGREGQNREPCMTADHLRALVREGMTVGSHGLSHASLGKIPFAAARLEIFQSKTVLESILGAPVRWFCYPKGSFDLEVALAVREAGYAGACATIRDNRLRADQLYYLPRIMAMRDTTPQRFAYHFSKYYHWLHAWKNRRRWKGFS